jgi:hypothetical protein
MYLVFLVFTSRLTSLLASIRVFVFFLYGISHLTTRSYVLEVINLHKHRREKTQLQNYSLFICERNSDYLLY